LSTGQGLHEDVLADGQIRGDVETACHGISESEYTDASSCRSPTVASTVTRQAFTMTTLQLSRRTNTKKHVFVQSATTVV